MVITPASGAAGANAQFTLSRYASFYRCALPVLPWSAGGSHEGRWHAVLRLGRAGGSRPLTHVAPQESSAYYDPKRAVLPYEFVAHTYSSLAFTASLTQSGYEPGDAAQLTATLTEYEVPVGRRASVWAEIRRPDGGSDAVGLAMDAAQRFAATYVLTLPGVYVVRIRAKGETTHGSPFERERTLTATAVPGGDIWDPNDPRPDPLCDLLHCLEKHGAFGGRLRELAKQLGIDLDGLLECLREMCRPGGTEDPRQRPSATTTRAVGTPASRQRLLDILGQLKAELGE
jgi:hypothetical protein